MADNRFQIYRRDFLKGMGLSVAAGAVGLPLPAFAQMGKRGGTLTVGLPYDQDVLNPFSTGFLPDVASSVIEGLMAPDQNAKYFPVLGVEVPTLDNGGIKVSADGKTMDVTFKLQPNAKWADGEPFTSEDIKFTWLAIKDPNFHGESKDGVKRYRRHRHE